MEDAGCTDRVLFTEETLVDGGIKSPYYRLVFANMNTQWTYRIDAVLGIIMGKEKENIGTGIFIPLRQAQEIALKDAGLDEVAQKIVFTEIELILNQGRPCYVLDFYTGESRYYYQIDAKSGEIIFRNKYILPAEARRIAVEDAGCTDRVLFTEETLVDGGIKSPYYRLVFADTKTQWTYRIDAVLGIIMGKEKEDIGAGIFIPLRQAQEIALKDAGLDEAAQKIVFTEIELILNQGRPCYVLDFYTGESRYYYQIDAKSGEIIFRNKYILPAEARRIAVEDAGCTDRVLFIVETLVDGGIKSPYYLLVFADAKTQWTYRIDAVLGNIMGKEKENIGTGIFIPLRQAQEIALKDAGLDEVAQKIVFTEIELILNQGRPCYVLDFYTGESRYYYQIDAKSGEIIFRNKYILPAEARRIAVEDAGCTERVLFTEETLTSEIKTPYYRLVFADAKTQWTYRIDAVSGGILEKQKKDIGTTGQAWKNPFGDVRESDWFYRSVKFAYAGGLMRGVSDTEFSPDTDVTRAMFVMILYRIEKEPQAGSTSFADVEIGDYYEKAVAWANANGIVSGVSEKRFAPNEPITREQMATIIYRYAAFKGYDTRTSGKIAYTDSSDISDYAKDAVSWAAEEALMAGHADGRFLPRENATRAQTAAVFMRMLGDSK